MDERKIKQIYSIRAQIKDLQAQEAELKAELGNLELGESAVGPFIVKVTPNRRFDAARAAEVLNKRELESIMVKRPDSGVAKRKFPEKFDLMQREYDPKLGIILPEN